MFPNPENGKVVGVVVVINEDDDEAELGATNGDPNGGEAKLPQAGGGWVVLLATLLLLLLVALRLGLESKPMVAKGFGPNGLPPKIDGFIIFDLSGVA